MSPFPLTIKLRTALIIVVMFLCLIAGTYLGFAALVMRDAEKIELGQMRENSERVVRALKKIESELSVKNEDWAKWDDTYEFLHDQNARYIDSNINFASLNTIQVDYAVYFDKEGKVVVGYQLDRTASEVRPLSAEAREVLGSDTPLAKPHSAETLVRGLVTLGDRVLLAVSSSVTDSHRNKPVRGALTFATNITPELIQDLASQTRLQAAATPIRRLGPHQQMVLDKLLHGRNFLLEMNDTEFVSGYTIVNDIYGKPALLVSVEAKRTAYQQGLSTRNLMLIYLVVGGFAATLITVLLLDRSLLSRLALLSSEVREISLSGDSSKRVSMQTGDELGSLAEDINSMLGAMQRTREIEKAKNEAEAANKAKSVFIAKVSHELRTPLHGILGTLRIVLRQKLPQTSHNHLLMAQEAANGLLGIINDILDFSKLIARRISLQNVRYSVPHLVRDVINTVGPKAYERGSLELTAFVDSSVPAHIIGDPLRMKQILVNLIGNAIKFTTRGSVALEVAFSTERSSIIWYVSDTGCGIAEDRLVSIFEPFTQGDTFVTRRYSGTGLGLTIAKQLVDAMHGSIEVTSREHFGSTFRVEIPIAVEGSATTELAVGTKKSLNGHRAAVVGEPGYFPDFLERSLSAAGASVRRIILSQPDQDTSVAENETVFIDGESLEVAKYFQFAAGAAAQMKGGEFVACLALKQLLLTEKLFAAGIHHLLLKPLSSLDIIESCRRREAAAEADGGYDAGKDLQERGLKVLVAEDVPLNQLVLKTMLEDNGFNVTVVEDGEALVEAVQDTLRARAAGERGAVDIVLTDIQMPKMDGVEAAMTIRAAEQSMHQGELGKLPILAITAHAFVEEHTHIVGAGIDAVLTKPLDPAALWKNIETLLRSGRIADRGRRPAPVRTEPEGVHQLALQNAALAVDTILDSNARTLENVKKVYRAYAEEIHYPAPESLNEREMKSSLFGFSALYEHTGRRPEAVVSTLETFLAEYQGLVANLSAARNTRSIGALRCAIQELKAALSRAGCPLGRQMAEIAERQCDLNSFSAAEKYVEHVEIITLAFADVVEMFQAEQMRTAGFVAG